MLGLFVLFITMFPDDDDKKTFAARYLKRTFEDASMGLNPKDLFDSMKKPVAALDRLPVVGNAAWSFFTEGITGKTNSEGWPVGLKTIARNTPGASSALQIHDLFTDYDYQNDNTLFGIINR